ncbi:MAG: hypothetical protein ACK40H_07005, partial [Sphingomonadaceae bacterium]
PFFPLPSPFRGLVWGLFGPVWFPLPSAKAAALEEERALVSGGLAAGERVVALGAHLLREGQQVRLADAPGRTLAHHQDPAAGTAR